MIVPPLSGIGTQPAVQVPLANGSDVTLINLDKTYDLVLCNDDSFQPNTTWPLPSGNVIPQPGINNLWVQNPNNTPVNILVLEGIVPVSLYQYTGSVGPIGPTGPTGPAGPSLVLASSTEQALTTTNPTTIISYVPSSATNVFVAVYFRVVGFATNVTVSITYTDVTGFTSIILLPITLEAVGSYSIMPIYLTDIASDVIAVVVTAGTINQVYASSTILQG